MMMHRRIWAGKERGENVKEVTVSEKVVGRWIGSSDGEDELEWSDLEIRGILARGWDAWNWSFKAAVIINYDLK